MRSSSLSLLLLLLLGAAAGAFGCSKNKEPATRAPAAAPPAVAVVADAGNAPAAAPGAAAAAAPAAGGPARAADSPRADQVVESLKKAGLPTEGFTGLQPVPYGANACQQGRVQGIDTLVCEYADPGSLDHGKKLLQADWGREGVQTGVALISGQTLLAIADRGHHDPNGKTINQIVKAFKKL